MEPRTCFAIRNVYILSNCDCQYDAKIISVSAMRFILYLPKRHIIMKIAIELSHSSRLALCYRMLNYSMVVLLASAVFNLKWLQFIVEAEGCFLMEFTSNGLIRLLSYSHALLELYMANTVEETNGGTCAPGLLPIDVTLFLITVDLLRGQT